MIPSNPTLDFMIFMQTHIRHADAFWLLKYIRVRESQTPSHYTILDASCVVLTHVTHDPMKT